MSGFRRWLALICVASLLTAGCLPWGKPSEVRKQADGILQRTATPTSTSGRMIAPKRNSLKTALVARPAKHEAIGEKLWAAADEQFLPADAKRDLESNGIRIGVISGSLPVDTEAVMNEAPPNRVDPVMVDLPDGDPSQVNLGTPVETTTLLITRDGRTLGKDYSDASGYVRFTANQDGQGGITLRITPEIHHGPVSKEFTAAPTGGNFSPQEFMMKTGQKEEQFRDLAATIPIKPGQIAVIGGRSETGRDLGSFLFSEVDKKNDMIKHKVLLIWASPNGNMSAIEAAKNTLPTASAPGGDRSR